MHWIRNRTCEFFLHICRIMGVLWVLSSKCKGKHKKNSVIFYNFNIQNLYVLNTSYDIINLVIVFT